MEGPPLGAALLYSSRADETSDAGALWLEQFSAKWIRFAVKNCGKKEESRFHF
jgi:hypothetical protein